MLYLSIAFSFSKIFLIKLIGFEDDFFLFLLIILSLLESDISSLVLFIFFF